jgi:hypothetical protein
MICLFINVPMGKLPHFDGTNFAKWKHLTRAYLIGLHPNIWEDVCNGFEPPVDPKNPTMEQMRIIHLNGCWHFLAPLLKIELLLLIVMPPEMKW